VAQALGYETQFKRLETLIGALLGTQAARHLTAPDALVPVLEFLGASSNTTLERARER
jgi:hypothetical protein